MTQPTPPTSARVAWIVVELMREHADHQYAYAIGRIDGYARDAGLEDTEARAAIRDVLDALDIVTTERLRGAQ